MVPGVSYEVPVTVNAVLHGPTARRYRARAIYRFPLDFLIWASLKNYTDTRTLASYTHGEDEILPSIVISEGEKADGYALT